LEAWKSSCGASFVGGALVLVLVSGRDGDGGDGGDFEAEEDGLMDDVWVPWG